MTFPAIYLGDFAAQRIVPLALIPLDAASGGNVRAIRLVAGEDIQASGTDYWLLDVGILDAGALKLLAQRPLVDGFSANVARTLTFTDPLLVSRGDMLACRLSPRGAPPPLSGLNAVVEWGSLSTNRSAR